MKQRRDPNFGDLRMILTHLKKYTNFSNEEKKCWYHSELLNDDLEV